MRAIKKKLKHLLSPKYAYLKRFKVRADDVVIDLGANVGEVSEYFIPKRAIIHAYEPNPYAFDLLTKRVGKYGNITLYPAAVSNQNGKMPLFLHKSHGEGEVHFSQASSLQGDKSNVSGDSVEVDVLDIKDVLSKADHIKLIKIDIEGGEYDIMEDILDQGDKIDYILLETHEKKNEAFAARHEKLMQKIAISPHKHKIFMDWF